MSRYKATVEWGMERDNGWRIWDKAKFRTVERARAFKKFLKEKCPRACRIKLEEKE